MKKLTQLSEKGFSAVEGLLIVVFVGLIAGIGYYVFNQSQKKDETSQPQSNVSIAEKQEAEGKPKESVSDSHESSTKYLEIKEYGIKLALTSEIHDAYYVMNNSYPYMSVSSLDEYPGCVANKKEALGIAAVSKGKIGDDRFGSPITVKDMESTGAVKVGETYYWVELSNGGSCTEEKDSEAESAVRKAFSEAKISAL